MRHWFKQQSIQDLVRYNKHLLLISLIATAAALIACLAAFNREDKWLLIPAVEPERRMIASSKTYHETYLREWAIFVMKELFTTSPAELERQIADLKIISSATPELEKFFKEHLNFVQGSRVSSVFFPKTAKIVADRVAVSGTFRYWFDGSDKHVAEEKTYILNYKRGKNQLLLLTNIEESKG